jgi:hypothetical protein
MDAETTEMGRDQFVVCPGRLPDRQVEFASKQRAQGSRSNRPGVQISDSSHTSDSLCTVCVRAELPPKITHVKINAAVKRRKLPAQDAFRQVFPGKYLAGTLQKNAKQIKLRGR